VHGDDGDQVYMSLLAKALPRLIPAKRVISRRASPAQQQNADPFRLAPSHVPFEACNNALSEGKECVHVQTNGGRLCMCLFK